MRSSSIYILFVTNFLPTFEAGISDESKKNLKVKKKHLNLILILQNAWNIKNTATIKDA